MFYNNIFLNFLKNTTFFITCRFESDETPPICFDRNSTMHCFDQKLHQNEIEECFSKWKSIADETGLGTKKVNFFFF